MNTCFADLMYETFPNISQETKSKLHEHIRKRDLYSNWLFANHRQNTICQGDVVRELPIITIGRNGKPIKQSLSALLLNNTCDMQIDNGKPRSNYISIIPLFPFSEFIKPFHHMPNYEKDLKENVITDKFYVGDLPYEDSEYVADLSMACSLSSEYLHNMITQGEVEKVTSLSDNGYYFFLAKMTLHLMRPESEEIERESAVRCMKK